MKRLVVCADDAGLAASSDEAILRCMRGGVVGSASVVAGGATAEEFLAQAEGCDLGLHFNITQGQALAGVARTLTDSIGNFVGPKQAVWGRQLDGGELRREFLAQWSWLVERGVEPTHVNGHNHVHVFLDEFPDVWVRVPLDATLPEEILDRAGRMGGRGHFTGCRFSACPEVGCFLESVRGDLVEFMVHPGSRRGSPFSSSPARDAEVAVLCSEELRAGLVGWELGGFLAL